jgi:D-amino-acid dehydrogenase
MVGREPVVVVGAGIAGACCAAALAADGQAVTVVDAGAPGEGCSHGNAGQFNLGSTLPIALPGMWRQVPGWLMDPLGPLAVRWRYLPPAAPWLARWVWESRRARARRHSLALKALAASCLDRYRGMLGAEESARLLRVRGHLHVYERAHLTDGDRLALEMMAAKGIMPVALGAGEVREMAPALAPIYARGLYFPENGHTVDPGGLVRAIVARSGATVLLRRVTGFAREGGVVTAVETEDGPLPCSAVVVAAGAGSRGLAAMLGARVPLEVERGYHLMLPAPGVALDVPVSNAEHTFVTTPMAAGLRLAGTVEIAGPDAPPDWRRAEVLGVHARRMLPGLSVEGAARWMGMRPSFPDSLPAIDRFPGAGNAFAAFGHGHYGVSLSPMTGRIVADLVAGRIPAVDMAPYRLGRFG